MTDQAANMPEEYRKATKAGGNAPLTKTTPVNNALSDASVRKICDAAVANTKNQPATPKNRP